MSPQIFAASAVVEGNTEKGKQIILLFWTGKIFIVYLFSAAIYRFKIVIDKSALSHSTTSHHHIVHLCLSVCLPASAFLRVSLSVYLCLHACLSIVCMFVCLPICLLVRLSVSLVYLLGKKHLCWQGGRQSEQNGAKHCRPYFSYCHK